ncbi:hypothetical protein ANO14919_028940 [Xylariales sp. No.14919]|nr:hypothetical protein ANO14919_028940 [Xylariales sp. No.14919]
MNSVGIIFPFQACRRRSGHSAKAALARLQVRYSSITANGAHQEKQAPPFKVRYDRGRVPQHDLSPDRRGVHHANKPVRSLRWASWLAVNARLAKTLEESRIMYQFIEDTLTSLAKDPETSVSDYLNDLELAAGWMKLEARFMASQRQYMQLSAAEAVLDVIWTNPHIKSQAPYSLKVLCCMTRSFRKERGWLGVRKLFVQEIRRVRKTIPYHISLYRPKGLRSTQDLLRFHQALDRAMVLVHASERLFLATRWTKICRDLTIISRDLIGLTDKVIEQHELIDDIERRELIGQLIRVEPPLTISGGYNLIFYPRKEEARSNRTF